MYLLRDLLKGGTTQTEERYRLCRYLKPYLVPDVTQTCRVGRGRRCGIAACHHLSSGDVGSLTSPRPSPPWLVVGCGRLPWGGGWGQDPEMLGGGQSG